MVRLAISLIISCMMLICLCRLSSYIPSLLYILFWPIRYSVFGIDCANADKVSEKLNCGLIALSVDWFVLCIFSYVILMLVFKLKKYNRQSDN